MAIYATYHTLWIFSPIKISYNYKNIFYILKIKINSEINEKKIFSILNN